MIYTFIFVCETIEPSMWNWSNSVKVKHSIKKPIFALIFSPNWNLFVAPFTSEESKYRITKNFEKLFTSDLLQFKLSRKCGQKMLNICWKSKKAVNFFYKMLHLQCLNTFLHGLLTTCSSFKDNFSTEDYFPWFSPVL